MSDTIVGQFPIKSILFSQTKMLANKNPKNNTETASMNRQSSYTYDELIKCGHGELFGPGNAQLPLPNMLMLDRITNIADDQSKVFSRQQKGIVKVTGNALCR